MIMGLGSSGPFVRDLQIALNARLMPSPNLMVNGVFNAKTQEAVTAFQEANWLQTDGQCNQATLDCLYGAEAQAPIQHNLRHLPHPDPKSGWAAMVAMLRGITSAAAIAATPQPVAAVLDDASVLANDQSQQEARQSVAQIHGLVLHQVLGLTVSRLIEALRKGPVGLERLSGPMVKPTGPATSRYLVVAAVRGSQSVDGATTTLRIYDPNPLNHGGVYSRTYANLLRVQPGSRFVMFSRQID